ncbi:MAG TPA: zinc-ribbon domain-containing protein, partial [Oscillospiraceae bacterium]|nr:zinc-ribbon domain-containing protein [Oscillospiraceae bacterium]
MGKFCGNCGAPLNPDARFCGSCGAAAEPARPPVAPARGGAAPRPKPARKSRKKGVIAVLSLIIVAALGAGFLFWFFGNSRMKPVTVERGPEPLAAQTASEAAAIALRQYIYARLATEAFAEADLEAMSVEEIRALAEDAARAWEDAALAASVAEEITAQAVEVLD